jgi:hypothetical protein
MHFLELIGPSTTPIVIDLKKIRITFERDVLRVIAPLDLDEGQRYT